MAFLKLSVCRAAGGEASGMLCSNTPASHAVHHWDLSLNAVIDG